MSRLTAILGAALLLAALPAAQNAWPATPEQQLHAKVVRAERTAAFFTAWEEADAELRARASAFLEAVRSPGAPAGRRPELSAIAAATHILRGVDPEVARTDGQQRFADALDLQVSPGLFAAQDQGEGEPMTVRFYRLVECSFHEDVVLGLLWIGPDGTEIRARTEAVAARHFETPGQVMYVRAPPARDGEWWRLVPEVQFEGRTVRGAGILVRATSANPEGLIHGYPPGAPAVADYLRKGLRAASFGGGRGLAHPLVPRSLTPLGARCPVGDEEPVRPEGLRLFAASDAEVERGEPPHPAPGSTVFLVLAPVGECAESVFLGVVGDAWLRLAREHRGYVCSVEFARKQGEDLLRQVDAWKDTSRGGAFSPPRVILVARGDAVTPLPFLFAGEGVPVDGLVLCTETSGIPRVLPRVPTLLVSGTPLEGEPGKDVTFGYDPTPVFLREPTLPDRIAAWLPSVQGR